MRTARRPATGGERVLRRGRRSVRLTRLDLLFWPDEGIRKRDLLAYYEAIAPVLVPHLRNRPFTFKRHYNGPRSPFEWIKDAPPELPPWIPVAPLPARSRGGELVRYALLNDALALLWAIDFGCVDLHVWSSRADRPERPDFVLFDLDPAGVPLADVVRAAHLVREALRALGLRSYPMTTGGEGLHVRAPVARRYAHADTRELAGAVAVALRRLAPDLVTTERSRPRRRGVYVDTKMNGHGQQVVAPYSVRPLPGAPVATPLAWEELDKRLDARGLTMAVVLDRVARDGDLLAPLLAGGQRLRTAALTRR